MKWIENKKKSKSNWSIENEFFENDANSFYSLDSKYWYIQFRYVLFGSSRLKTSLKKEKKIIPITSPSQMLQLFKLPFKESLLWQIFAFIFTDNKKAFGRLIDDVFQV